MKGPKVEEPKTPETKSLASQRANNAETSEKARKEKKQQRRGDHERALVPNLGRTMTPQKSSNRPGLIRVQ